MEPYLFRQTAYFDDFATKVQVHRKYGFIYGGRNVNFRKLGMPLLEDNLGSAKADFGWPWSKAESAWAPTDDYAWGLPILIRERKNRRGIATS